MAEVLDIGTKWINRRLPGAMRALGITAAAAVSNSIDTPYPPASKPGSPPHKRTGNLRAGVDHVDTVDTTTITSARAEGDSRVPIYLEFGTSKMAARPYMRPVMNQADSMVPQVMKQQLSGEAAAHESAD